jgi:hypothetical protein
MFVITSGPCNIGISLDNKFNNVMLSYMKILYAGIGQEYIGKMLLKYPWILSTSVIENYAHMPVF